jgi:DNA-binding NarL/FixJ family response regulator
MPTARSTLRILIVEDNLTYRTGLKVMLERFEPELRIAGEALNAEDALRLAGTLAPDLILFDLEIPEHGRWYNPKSCEHGLAAIKTISQSMPGTPILVLSNHEEKRMVLEAERAGASSYIAKDDVFDGDWLMEQIRAAARGAAIRGPTTAQIVDRLTQREWDVVDQLMQDMTNEQIAAELGISLATVKTHVSHILQKLELKRREELQGHPGVQVHRGREA